MSSSNATYTITHGADSLGTAEAPKVEERSAALVIGHGEALEGARYRYERSRHQYHKHTSPLRTRQLINDVRDAHAKGLRGGTGCVDDCACGGSKSQNEGAREAHGRLGWLFK